MEYCINKSSLKGELTIPSSKSQSHRAILFATLAKGKSIIQQHLSSPDTQAMIDACRLFGAHIDVAPDHLIVQGLNGKIKATQDVINAGNSGIVLRFCSAVGALGSNPIVITGDHSIRHHRPMQPLLKGLSQLGVTATSMRGDGYAPIIIQGPLQPGKAELNGEDSQPVSGLLIASAFVDGPVELHVCNPGEKPWVDLTLNWFSRLGISYQQKGYEQFRLSGHANYPGFEYRVPGDLSTAAFPVAAALITGSEITINNVDMSDSQGDKELIYAFQKMGAKIEIDDRQKQLKIKKSTLHGINVDINNFVDAITILAVVACFAEGETYIQNGKIAKRKECNRIHCIATELQKMGANISETDDGLIIHKSTLNGTVLNSYNDHRMAMSLAVATLGAKGESKICDVECVSKTFPTFLQDFNSLGANIKEVQ